MTVRPFRPPSAVMLTLASFVLTTTLLAGPQIRHRLAPAATLARSVVR